MKSVAMGFSATIGYLFVLILFWGIAILVIRAAMKQWQQGGRWSVAIMAVFGLWCLLVPHWGQFPGWALAEIACRNVGGQHTYQSIPVVSDGLLVQNAQFRDDDLVRTLLIEGFNYVEEIRPKNGFSDSWKIPHNKKLRYRIGKLSDAECAQFGVIRTKAPEAIAKLYLHGMRADECLVVELFETPTAKVALRKYEEFKFFPTPIVYSVNDVVWTDSKEPIAALRGFYYYESNPRAGGNPEFLDCHNTEARSGSNGNKGWVQGPAGRFPSRVVTPNSSSTADAILPLDIKVTAGEETLYAGQRVDYFKDAIGVDLDDVELWSKAGMEPAVYVVTRERENSTAYAIPPLERGAVNYDGHDQGWELSRFGKVLAFRRHRGRMLLIRAFGGFWEIGELDTSSNSWQRAYVSVSDAFRAAHPSNIESRDFEVVVSLVEVADDNVRVEGLVMNSAYISEYSPAWARLAITVPRLPSN